ncbi:MAG: hypothetical protein ABIJ56_16640 [Pseudomonadota bacterium]
MTTVVFSGCGEADSNDDAAADPQSDRPADIVDTAGDADEAVDSSDAGEEPVEEELPACEPEQTSPGSGYHHPGDDCAPCHASMSGEKKWKVSGTLYASAAGEEPAAGVTIVFRDADGNVFRLITHDNGNFYTSDPVAFPITPRASRCPDNAQMPNPTSAGNCNNCHYDGQRIYFP